MQKSKVSKNAKIESLPVEQGIEPDDEIEWCYTPMKTFTNAVMTELQSCYLKAASKTHKPKVRLRFKAELMAKLGWKVGDKVVVYYNKQHVMHQKICKTDSGSGLILKKSSKNSLFVVLDFTWCHLVPIEAKPFTDQPFTIEKGCLNLILPGS